MLPDAPRRVGAPVVPAAQHREEVLRERGLEDRVGLVDGEDARTAERLQHVLLHVARAVLGARIRGIPERVDAVGQVQLLRDPRGEAAEEEVGVRLAFFIDELKVEQGRPLAEIHARLHGPHQQRALAHLPRSLDRHRLARLLDQRQRRCIRLAWQIPLVVDVERASWYRQRRRVRRRQVRGRRGGHAENSRLRGLVAADGVAQFAKQARRIRGAGPDGV